MRLWKDNSMTLCRGNWRRERVKAGTPVRGNNGLGPRRLKVKHKRKP